MTYPNKPQPSDATRVGAGRPKMMLREVDTVGDRAGHHHQRVFDSDRTMKHMREIKSLRRKARGDE